MVSAHSLAEKKKAKYPKIMDINIFLIFLFEFVLLILL